MSDKIQEFINLADQSEKVLTSSVLKQWMFNHTSEINGLANKETKPITPSKEFKRTKFKIESGMVPKKLNTNY